MVNHGMSCMACLLVVGWVAVADTYMRSRGSNGLWCQSVQSMTPHQVATSTAHSAGSRGWQRSACKCLKSCPQHRSRLYDLLCQPPSPPLPPNWIHPRGAVLGTGGFPRQPFRSPAVCLRPFTVPPSAPLQPRPQALTTPTTTTARPHACGEPTRSTESVAPRAPTSRPVGGATRRTDQRMGPSKYGTIHSNPEAELAAMEPEPRVMMKDLRPPRRTMPPARAHTHTHTHDVLACRQYTPVHAGGRIHPCASRASTNT